MGATLGKSKSGLISEKTNEQEKSVTTTSNNHIDGTSTLEKMFKKKTERNSDKKSSHAKVDKYTSTDGGIISSSSSCIKQLVGDSKCNNVSYDVHSVEMDSTYQSETPSKDILEFRDACVRRGIISSETNNFLLLASKEQNYQANIVDESTNETSTAIITNNELVKNDQQQVES
ncbi:unnamed protein product [Rotaria sp. Silwood2]|nr:unnamed protein product [Rotaria sp. Silwood2]CAF2592538.1 unnamed protein product [Rotaria sp. Silwood2]CAF2832893.1 unnamed protein product [Rotaria sp. Silwood2]CAF2976992.1 unnamed protein product [Rotaria sp. Silwood2]CAF3875862.1 unnamed protein product [Rotaria sp. Silwood2]